MEKRSLQDKNNTKSTSSEDESNIESSARLSSGATVQERTSASQHEEPTLGTLAGQHERPTPGEQGTKRNTNEQSEKQTEYNDSLAEELLSDIQEVLSGLQADDTSRHTGREVAEENEDFLSLAELARGIIVPPSVSDLIDDMSNEQKLSDSNLLAPSTSRGLPPDVSDSTEEISDVRRSLDFDPFGPSTSSGSPLVDELFPESQDLQDEDGDYECELCEFKARVLSDLRTHINKYHENETKECKKCSKQYDTGDKLAMHIYNCHKRRMYLCVHCGHIFKTRQDLHGHFMRCDRKRKYLAPGTSDASGANVLEATFPAEQLLPPSIVNIGRRPIQPITWSENHTHFECVLCDPEMSRRSPSISAVMKHIEQAHGKTFRCRKCNQSFPISAMLKEHIRQLHRVEPYKCRYCRRIYIDYCVLASHEVRCETTSKETKKPKRG